MINYENPKENYRKQNNFIFFFKESKGIYSFKE